MIDLVTIGDINSDFTVNVPRFPKEDDEVQIEDMQQILGGDATNIAVAASKLGLKTALIACLGSDAENLELFNKLREHHVILDGVRISKTNKTGLVISIVRKDGERNLLSYRGANSELSIGPEQAYIIYQSKALHVSDPIPEVENWFIEQKPTGNQVLSFDPGSITAARGIKSLQNILAKVNLLFVNEVELEMLTGIHDLKESARRMLAQGPQLVTVKMGKRGCYIATPEITYQLPGYKINAVDSTGAGDAFDAAFLTMFLKGSSLPEAAQFANAVGAITATRFGAQEALIDEQQVIDFMKSNIHDKN